MTTLNQAKQAIYTRFLANMTGTSNIVFDNENPPFDEQSAPSWARLAVRSIIRAQDTLGASGNRRFRAQASTLIQVYTLVDSGVSLSDTLAKEAADIFDAVSFSGLDFLAATIRETGPEGKWYQSVVEAPFLYDEIK